MVSAFRNILTYQFLKCTQHAILDIVNDIQDNMDKKMFSCGIFIDLKKLLILLITLNKCKN